jgi:hypothetical protein
MTSSCKYLLSMLEPNAKDFWDASVIKNEFHSSYTAMQYSNA